MLDAITLERRGIPAAAVGVQKLVETTGRGMGRGHGAAEYSRRITCDLSQAILADMLWALVDREGCRQATR